MAIDENTREDGFRDHEDGGKEYFAEHNERMKLFRESHNDWTTTRMTPRVSSSLVNMVIVRSRSASLLSGLGRADAQGCGGVKGQARFRDWLVADQATAVFSVLQALQCGVDAS